MSSITSPSAPIHPLACHAAITLATKSPQTKHAYLIPIGTILAALAGVVALGIIRFKSSNTSPL